MLKHRRLHQYRDLFDTACDIYTSWQHRRPYLTAPAHLRRPFRPNASHPGLKTDIAEWASEIQIIISCMYAQVSVRTY